MDRSVLLRAGAALVAGASFVGANAYVVEHPKNAEAPLRPPTTGEVVLRGPTTPAPSATALPAPTGSSRPGAPGRPTPRPSALPPQITLRPGVRATELPGISFTHVS